MSCTFFGYFFTISMVPLTLALYLLQCVSTVLSPQTHAGPDDPASPPQNVDSRECWTPRGSRNRARIFRLEKVWKGNWVAHLPISKTY